MGHAHSHGDDTLGRIGTSQVRAWLADTRVAGASAATMQRRWSAARVFFFRWAANEAHFRRSDDRSEFGQSTETPAGHSGVDQARHILDEAVAQARHDESPTAHATPPSLRSFTVEGCVSASCAVLIWVTSIDLAAL
ncbi:tyrosine recombinase XerC [Cutibacterium acnes JCM 18916]|nr:tyrosine recombinase XerC [Cutibacterium acnes JCM 18916]